MVLNWAEWRVKSGFICACEGNPDNHRNWKGKPSAGIESRSSFVQCLARSRYRQSKSRHSFWRPWVKREIGRVKRSEYGGSASSRNVVTLQGKCWGPAARSGSMRRRRRRWWRRRRRLAGPTTTIDWAVCVHSSSRRMLSRNCCQYDNAKSPRIAENTALLRQHESNVWK